MRLSTLTKGKVKKKIGCEVHNHIKLAVQETKYIGSKLTLQFRGAHTASSSQYSLLYNFTMDVF